jgi:hypothetical protein
VTAEFREFVEAHWAQVMTVDSSEWCREAAAECLRLAQDTFDQQVRVSLLAMAQKWLEIAGDEFGSRRFKDIVDDFNDRQMTKN